MKLRTITRSFLFQILVLNLLLISLIIFTLSTILYFNFRSIGIKIVTESIRDRLSQTSYSTSYLKDASLGAISQVYMDADITDVLNTKDLGNIDVTRLKMKLQRIVNSSNFIDSISVYSGVNDMFISTNDYVDKKEKEFLLKYVDDTNRNNEVGSSLHPIPRKITGGFSDKELVSVYSYIMFSDFMSDNQPEKAVILNVKEDWMRNVIKSAGSKYLGNVFILNQNGLVMSHTSQEMFQKTMSSQDYVKRVLNGGNAGYFTAEIDNVRSLVTYVSSNQLGWKFISILPFSAVISDMEHIRNNTFRVGIVIFFLGIILSYFFARSASFPIYNLKKKVMELKSSGSNSAGDIEFITFGVNEAATKLRTLESMKMEKAVLEKENFLRNLLLDCNDSNYGRSDIKSRLLIDLESSIMVIIFKIDNFHEFKNKSNIKDCNLLKFAICNIACELLSAVYAVEATDTGEDNIALLINTIGEVQNTEEDSIQPYFIEIQKAVLKYLELSITVAVGCISNNAAELNTSYTETIKSFQYRMILGHQSIITYSYVMSVQEKEYVFPENMENNMIEALKLCRKEQAEQIFFEIVNHAIELGINALHLTIIRLVIAISSTAQTIKIYYDADNLANMDVNTLIIRVNQMETLKQITAFFVEYFQRIIEALDEKRSTKTTMLIYTVKKYIESNYVDPNLSLKSIADLHHISTAYLGKLFKENVGESVSEHINEVRLNEALKLLSETSMPINDIVDKTGNTSTLFFRYFRKAFGITPNEYRKSMQKPNSIS